MLNPLCDIELQSWPWTFKVKLWNSRIPRMGGQIDTERKWCESIGCWIHYVTLTFPWPWTCIFKVKFSNSHISGMGVSWLRTKGLWVRYDVGPIMQPWICLQYGFARGLQHVPNTLAELWVDAKLLQFPTCWPIYGLPIPGSMGWGVLSFSEHIVLFIFRNSPNKFESFLQNLLYLNLSHLLKINWMIKTDLLWSNACVNNK